MSDPTQFEHYTVLEREDGSLWELGRGAMGVTYKAIDTDLHCTVALKVINPAILDTEGTAQRFLREARAAAQLRHPNIATVLRLGKTQDGTHFYAMEFCEGDTLEQLVTTAGPVKVDLALEFTLQIAKALVAAEEHHVVHRDIKPANLIIGQRRDEGPVVKVIDFGLAKSVAGAGNAWSSITLATAGFIGTAHFSSPEQLEDGAVDVRSDIYSLGATLWFMLTGQPMFRGSVPRVMSQHLSSSPPWENLRSAAVPEGVRQLLEAMLAKDPNDRPQSAVDLKQKIQLCLRDGLLSASMLRGQESDATASASRVLNRRWKLVEELEPTVEGLLYRAIDLCENGQLVGVRFLSPALTRKVAWAALERVVRLLALASDSVVRPVNLDRDHNDRPFLVTQWVNGIPLLVLLRRRGSLTLKEVIHLLKDLVPAFDYAVDNQIKCAGFNKDQVLLNFPNGTAMEEQFAELVQKPVSEWPGVSAMIDLLPVSTSNVAAGETVSSMQTMLPGRAASEEGEVPRLQSLGLFVYELLGGTAKNADRYVPVARLSAEGNDLLKHALHGLRQPGLPATGAQFLEHLTKCAGFEPAWKPPVTQTESPMDAQVHQPYDRSSKWLPIIIKAHPTRWTIAAIVLIAGLFWLVIQKADQESEAKPLSSTVVEAPKLTPAEVAKPVAPLSSAVPRVELFGTLVSTQYSPQRNIRVEHRSGGYIYLIALSDETKPFLFQTSANPKDEILFSGDEKWLVFNTKPHASGGTSQLYYRVYSDDVRYVQASNKNAGESFTDALWQFYLREVGLPSTTSRYDTGIMAVEWRTDSNAFRFHIESFGPEARKVVPKTYECDYQVNAQRLSSVTDTAGIRGALAGTNATQPPSQQTPVPAPSPIVSVPTQAPTAAPTVAVPGPPSTTPSFVTRPAGRFPETGTRVFSAAELQSWSTDQLQYAINEIFARHGAVFSDQKLQKEFSKLAWYHPQPNLTFEQVERSLPEIERQNVQLFGNVRDLKKAANSANANSSKRQTNVASSPTVTPPEKNAKSPTNDAAAGFWCGIFYFADGTFAKQELMFDPATMQMSDRTSDYNNSSQWNKTGVTKKGQNLTWRIIGGNPPRTINKTMTPASNGQVATATCQVVEQGRVVHSATGTFGRDNVPLPTQ